MAEYIAMLEEAVLKAEQMIADREAAHRKGIYEPKAIFAAADAVRAARRAEAGLVAAVTAEGAAAAEWAASVRAARRPAGGWHITHSVEIERNAE